MLVWSSDRLARSTKHFLHALDELSELGIQFLSQREAIDTDGPLGRAIVVIISAIAELERSLIVERVRAGMRRAKLEGRRIVRTPPDVNHAARLSGMSLTDVAKKYGLSGASIVRFVRDSQVRLAGDPPPQLVTASETVNIEEVELGFVANLETLREVLKELSINGRRWWVASDPRMPRIPFFDYWARRSCLVDRLNTLYFRVPVLNDEKPLLGTDRLILLIDSSIVSAELAGALYGGGTSLGRSFRRPGVFLSAGQALIAMLRE